MNSKIDISNYKPFLGFYDLRDFKLTITEFKKLWNIQKYLYHVESHKKYFKEFNVMQWEKAKELSADYQQILFNTTKISAA